VNDPPENFVTISGCFGGGKSTVLAELRGCGFATIDEPGRRIVDEELKRGGALGGCRRFSSACDSRITGAWMKRCCKGI
jgi:hypothetical protein